MNTRLPQSRPTGRFRLTALALALSAMLPAQAKTLAYIPSQGSNTVTVINTANDQVVRKYKRLTPDRAGPFGVAVSSSHGNLFVSHPFYKPSVGAPDLVTMIQPDARNQTPLNVAVQDGAYGIAADPSGWKVYQANAATGSISVLSAAGTLRAHFDTQLRWPMGIAVLNVNRQTLLFVTENQGNSVAVVDPVYGRVLKRITVGKAPIGIVASPDGTRVFVANYGDSSVSILDTASQSVLLTTPVDGHPYGLALSTDAQTLFASLQNTDDRQRPIRGAVAFLDANTLTERLHVKVGKTPVGVSVAMTPRGEKLYVANQGSNSVSVIATSVKAPKIIKTLATGNKPSAFGTFVADTSPEGIPGSIANFVGEAIAKWGQSEFMKLVGIKTSDQIIQEQLNTVINDLQAIQNQLNDISNQLTALTQDFFNLQEEMQKNNYQAQALFLNQIETGTATNWTQFQNSLLNSGIPCKPREPATADNCVYFTLPEVLGQPASLTLLSGLLSTSYLGSLAQSAQQMSNTGTSGPLNQTVPDYLTSANQLLQAQIKNYVTNGFNIMSVENWTPPGQTTPQSLSVFDQYNNGLMNQYLYLIQALQQIYTIETTAIYLQANLPQQFGGIVLAEPGIGFTTPQNYQSQLNTLNNLFTQRADQLYALFSQAIVSDAGGTSPNLPTKTGQVLGLSGNWNTATSLYVWEGLLPSGENGYEGYWNGTTLTSQYPTGWSSLPGSLVQYSINSSTQNCQASSGINFWQLTGWPSKLQCAAVTTPPVEQATNTSLALEYSASNTDPNAYFYFNLPSGNTNFYGTSRAGPNIFSLNSSSSNQYKAKTHAALVNDTGSGLVQGSFLGNFSFNSSNGYIGQYIINGTGSQKPGTGNFQVYWNMGLACTTGEFCYNQGPGICLAGDYLVTYLDQGKSNTASVFVLGSCSPPSSQ